MRPFSNPKLYPVLTIWLLAYSCIWGYKRKWFETKILKNMNLLFFTNKFELIYLSINILILKNIFIFWLKNTIIFYKTM